MSVMHLILTFLAALLMAYLVREWWDHRNE